MISGAGVTLQDGVLGAGVTLGALWFDRLGTGCGRNFFLLKKRLTPISYSSDANSVAFLPSLSSVYRVQPRSNRRSNYTQYNTHVMH
jgi:hypothetical protein